VSRERKVLLALAETLDPLAVLKSHRIKPEELSAILARAAQFFGGEERTKGARDDSLFTLFVDGASRGNPGPAGAGFVIRRSGKMVEGQAQYLGRITSNQAEYNALLLGLRQALELGAARIEVISDSELMVRQMNGQYRVKHPALKPLFEKARELSQKFKSFTIRHVPREQNREADRLANRAIDEFSPSDRG